MIPLRHRNAMRRLVGVAVLALLLGQWTVLAHTIVHAQASAAGTASVETDYVWGHDAGSSTCHLIDHLLLGQAPGGDRASVACLAPPALRVAAPAPSANPVPGSRSYEARGPPRA